MAHFITTDIGLINLDRVLRIERGATINDRVTLHLDNGEQLQCRTGGWDYRVELARVIPAAPETVATIISAEPWDGCPTAEGDLEATVEPIFAWRDTDYGLVPVFRQDFEGGLDDDYYTVFLHFGTELLGLDGSRFDTLEEAKQSVLSNAKRRWERRQKEETDQ